MNSIPRIVLPCATVADWLAHNTITKCPSGHALGLSRLEAQFGTTAKDETSWATQIRQRNSNEVLAAKQKRLRALNK